MKSQIITCPLCQSTTATMVDVPERASWQVDCPRCTQYRVTYYYWDEFTSDSEVKKVSSRLSDSIPKYNAATSEVAAFGSRGDVNKVLGF